MAMFNSYVKLPEGKRRITISRRRSKIPGISIQNSLQPGAWEIGSLWEPFVPPCADAWYWDIWDVQTHVQKSVLPTVRLSQSRTRKIYHPKYGNFLRKIMIKLELGGPVVKHSYGSHGPSSSMIYCTQSHGDFHGNCHLTRVRSFLVNMIWIDMIPAGFIPTISTIIYQILQVDGFIMVYQPTDSQGGSRVPPVPALRGRYLPTPTMGTRGRLALVNAGGKPGCRDFWPWAFQKKPNSWFLPNWNLIQDYKIWVLKNLILCSQSK